MVYFEKQIENDLRTKVRCSKGDLTVKDRNQTQTNGWFQTQFYHNCKYKAFIWQKHKIAFETN